MRVDVRFMSCHRRDNSRQQRPWPLHTAWMIAILLCPIMSVSATSLSKDIEISVHRPRGMSPLVVVVKDFAWVPFLLFCFGRQVTAISNSFLLKLYYLCWWINKRSYHFLTILGDLYRCMCSRQRNVSIFKITCHYWRYVPFCMILVRVSLEFWIWMISRKGPWLGHHTDGLSPDTGRWKSIEFNALLRPHYLLSDFHSR